MKWLLGFPYCDSNSSTSSKDFSYENKEHLELIQKQLNHFKEKLTLLQQIDRNIFIGSVISTGCYIGSYIFPLTLFSIAGGCFASYNLAKREQASLQYREALNDLIQFYDWVMGKKTKHHWEKLGIGVIQELILTLGPWVSGKTIGTWKEEDIKPKYSLLSQSAKERKEFPQGFEKKLHQFASGSQALEWSFRLYGEHGSDDIYNALKTNIALQLNQFGSWMKKTN